MTRVPLADQSERDIIANDFDSTLVVEAAAGTGKTTELVNRIVRIIAHGLANVSEIVAVTFTEKAAGELKLRLREKLETSRATATGKEQERLGEALAHLEEAHVSTIHGFCAELLRERPVEARLDPLFATLTDGQSRQLFDQAFMSWFQECLDHPPEGVRRALRRTPASGFKRTARDEDPEAPIDRLRNAAWKLADWRDFRSEWRRPAFDREREIDRLIDRVHAFAALTESPGWKGDPLYAGTRCARQISEAIRRITDVGRIDYDGWESQLIDLSREPLERIKGGKSGMYRPGLTRADVIAARDTLVQDLKQFCQLADADLAALLATELRGALDRYTQLKDANGSADFLDLLIRARDLLRNDAEILRTFQKRFKRIFVDEFQDTDPVQAEILLLLAADESITPSRVAAGLQAGETDSNVVSAFRRTPDKSVVSAFRRTLNSENLELRPGALFIVADPKQSIYRFRRADVGVYFEVCDLLKAHGAKIVKLYASFRAQPSMQAFVNAAFAPDMTGDRNVLQADYVALSAYRRNLPDQPSVVALPVPRPYGKVRIAKSAIEASLPAAIAAYIDWLINESGWRVSVPPGVVSGFSRTSAVVSGFSRTSENTEPISARHICVLFRRFITWGDDVTRPYVDELEARAIPHVLVGGRTFHEREEVENLRAALTAIEWPDDELSVFATLRGSLFAIGDEELLEWRQRFGHLHPARALRLQGRGRRAVAPQEPKGGGAEADHTLPNAAGDADGHIPAHLHCIAEALSLLRSLNIARNHRPIAETIHRLLDATRAHVSFVLRPRGEQVLANVLQVGELARQYEQEGGLSFRGFVEALREEAQSAQAAEAPVIEEGADGVRLMTVHKAKGLEFPVVILADITAKLAQREPDRYIDPGANLCVLKLGGWMPEELRDHAALETQRDEAEGVRLAYVAATRARDLLVVPAVGDKPFDEGWLRPLNRAIYPLVLKRRVQQPAPGCPEFKSKDSVLERPNSDPFSLETVCPGLHEFGDAADACYSVAWWDPRALQLTAEAPSGIRRPELITKEADPKLIADGLAVYKSWRASREKAIEAGSHPSMRVLPATAWAARAHDAADAANADAVGRAVRSADPTDAAGGPVADAVGRAVRS
ncbi:MAG: UvrD-helicase domain-containing protein, partial [Acidobacteriota bacterium]